MTSRVVHEPRKHRSSGRAAGWLTLLLLAIACARPPSAVLPSNPANPAISEGATRLPRAAPSEVGVDAGALERMLHYLTETRKGVDVVLVMRHGKVILEAYAYPHRPMDRHALYSCTKSVTSILTGIALADGRIPGGLDARVVDLFPEWKLARGDELKARITLRDLLTMRSGLEWNENGNYGMPGDSSAEMAESADPARFVLERPMHAEPGTEFHYNSGASHLIGVVVQKATGKTLAELAEEKLFAPLGIRGATWQRTRDGLNWGGWGLALFPEDMAKLGQLFLDGGQWNEKQVVPAAWVEESTRKWTETSQFNVSELGYGFQWWRFERGYMAAGLGGQFIFVNPDQDLVAVFFSALPNEETVIPRILMEQFVGPAADAIGSPAADRQLLRAVAEFERKPMPKPTPLPAIARSLHGARFAMEDGSRLGIAFPSDGEAVATITSPSGACVFRVGLDGVPRVNACHLLSDLPGRGPAALTGWFDGRELVIRHAAIDGADELFYRVALGEDRIELSLVAFHSGGVVYRTTGTRER